jgi:hypothetical protein
MVSPENTQHRQEIWKCDRQIRAACQVQSSKAEGENGHVNKNNLFALKINDELTESPAR